MIFVRNWLSRVEKIVLTYKKCDTCGFYILKNCLVQVRFIVYTGFICTPFTGQLKVTRNSGSFIKNMGVVASYFYHPCFIKLGQGSIPWYVHEKACYCCSSWKLLIVILSNIINLFYPIFVLFSMKQQTPKGSKMFF